MLQKIKTYDNIVSGFTKTMTDLDTLMTSNDKKLEVNVVKIQTLEKSSELMLDENFKASAMNKKLQEFLGVPSAEKGTK